MSIITILEKTKKGAPGVENIMYMMNKNIPKKKKKLPRLRKSVYGVDGGGE